MHAFLFVAGTFFPRKIADPPLNRTGVKCIPLQSTKKFPLGESVSPVTNRQKNNQVLSPDYLLFLVLSRILYSVMLF
jgi:hypothetical protein